MSYNRLFVFLLVLLLFSSCGGNSDYAYNEFVASQYKSVSAEFEASYEKLINGEYKTTYDLQGGYDGDRKEVRNLRNNTKRTIENVNELIPSDNAKKLHDKLNEYFKLVGEEYTAYADSYLNIDCECPEKRDSVVTQIKALYGKISSVEDDALELQLEFMKKSGMKPKE
ncbi:MAG: hypothetical protein ACLVKO_09385 [Dysgonomonas sp.]